MTWENNVTPTDGTWCWVTNGKDVWLAKSDRNSAGHWSNEDTWEDFNREVIAWIPLEKPVWIP